MGIFSSLRDILMHKESSPDGSRNCQCECGGTTCSFRNTSPNVTHFSRFSLVPLFIWNFAVLFAHLGLGWRTWTNELQKRIMTKIEHQPRKLFFLNPCHSKIPHPWLLWQPSLNLDIKSETQMEEITMIVRILPDTLPANGSTTFEISGTWS